jgi:hypothetical protein
MHGPRLSDRVNKGQSGHCSLGLAFLKVALGPAHAVGHMGKAHNRLAPLLREA